MKTRRTLQQWQKLLTSRETFDGTNIEFCQQHNISITSFYKHQALCRKLTTSGFVQVRTTTEQVQVEDHTHIEFDVHSGKLALPVTMPPLQVVELIRGLSS